MTSATLAPSPATPAATQTIAWLGLSLRVPADWEIVRHSPSPRKGSLVFADRTRQRMQVTWTACTKRPDVARLLADHRAKQREEDADMRVTTPLLPAGWRGTQRHLPDGRRLTRAARFDPKASRLIEVVVDHAEGSSLIEERLRDLVVTDSADAARHFRAFHLDLTVPNDFRLTATQVQPADTILTFATQPDAKRPDKHPALTVRRRGMADVWFDGDLRRLLQAYAPRVRMEYDRDERSGITTATWNLPGPRLHRLLNLHRVAVAQAWLDPEDNAVFDMVATGPAKSTPTLDDVRLAGEQGGDDR